jgi:PKD repeat protein
MRIYIAIFVSVLIPSIHAQNELRKWYFGEYAALDFMTAPPTVLSVSSMSAGEGCSSIADAQGNLLFYAYPENIWNKSHSIMANGGGLLGNFSASQGVLIAKQPGNTNLYYVFTLDDAGGLDGLRYSIVDMNLAAGMGSVTVKNILLQTPSTEKMTATRHCNGKDIWIVTHEFNSDKFHAFLLTSSGISPSAVISTVGTTITTIGDVAGQMKISAQGKKLAMTLPASSITALFDFNNSSGVISNSLVLDNSLFYPDGIEFSGDGSKLYITSFPYNNDHIHQFDLCGSPISIINSKTLIANTAHHKGMQRGPDGKIYVARINDNFISVIASPNAAGASCSFIDTALSVAPNKCQNQLPNIILPREIPPFTFTASCQQVQFASVAQSNTVSYSCGQAIYTVTGTSWNFGDPASGTSNVSSQTNPLHFYSAPGAYTAQVIRQYACGSDTVKQIINVTASPGFTINGPASFCKGDTHTLSITPGTAQTFTWGAPQSSNSLSVVVSPTATTVFNVTGRDSVSGCTLNKSFTFSLKSCLGVSEALWNGLQVYPNPPDRVLNVAFESDISVIVRDPAARVLYVSNTASKMHQIDMTGFSSGVYFVEITGTVGRKTVAVRR